MLSLWNYCSQHNNGVIETKWFLAQLEIRRAHEILVLCSRMPNFPIALPLTTLTGVQMGAKEDVAQHDFYQEEMMVHFRPGRDKRKRYLALLLAEIRNVN